MHQVLNLNSAQRSAIKYLETPLLVIAGAGSGKTRVITEKIYYLIETAKILPNKIFAITFTNKAALEMRERLGKKLGPTVTTEMQVSTFHTLGFNILKHDPEAAGLRSGFTLLDDQDALNLIRSLTEAQASFNKMDKAEAEKIAAEISRFKNNLISPEQALKKQSQTNSPVSPVIIKFYERYTRQLKAFNAVDFDDLITLPVKLLKENIKIREYWQRQIDYLLIDEYQDTNESQYQLIKLLTEHKKAFTAVGDDDQSIYAWRGARPENIEHLKLDFPNLKIILLEQNYRSTRNILTAANYLIQHNPHLVQKKLYSELGDGEPIKIIHCPDENIEAERIVSDIIGHQFQNKTPLSNYAILYRGNHQAMLFEKQLQIHRLPYNLSGGMSLFSRSEIKDILGFIRLLGNPHDDAAFLRVINTPKREMGPISLEKLGLYAKERNLSLFSSFQEIGFQSQLGLKAQKTIEKVNLFLNLIKNTQRKINQNPNLLKNILEEYLEYLDYYAHLESLSEDPLVIKKRYENCLFLIQLVDELGKNSLKDSAGLCELLNRLLISQTQEKEVLDKEKNQDLGKITLSTLHASKGLEFPYVFLTGLEEGLLPHQNSIDSNTVEEERRLTYVGITRAQSNLTITLCTHRNKFGEKIKTTPSRFLNELPTEVLYVEGELSNNQTEQKKVNSQKLETLKQLFKK